jgi:pyruvate dehydrogenase E2 component (dihydrolipoamide acetyltransferase)
VAIKEVKVPDLGGAAEVDVIEVLVAEGDSIGAEDSLVTLEGDKASMEIPSPLAGTVKEIKVKAGDKVSEGALIMMLETKEAETDEAAETTSEEPKSKSQKSPASSTREIFIPDLSGANDVDVIELIVAPGTEVEKDDSLLTLEGDKASMEVPAPMSGILKEFKIKVGDKVNQGDLMGLMEIKGAAASVPATKAPAETKTAPSPKVTEAAEPISTNGDSVHAGPAVRRIAREFGVDLQKVSGTGSRSRILKEDVQKFVKSIMSNQGTVAANSSGLNVAAAPQIDFSKFGEVETVKLSKIKRLTGINTHRSWVTVPHVTQFDEADITEMEAFRTSKKAEAEKLGYKLTPLVFMMKAVVKCMQAYPNFNSSLDAGGENLILKKYFHIGVAADTPNGLVVPVIRDVDKKGLFELSKELRDISTKAREKGLMPNEMSGSCFTISSLGGIGGTAFTPIVNTPDVAILGVSKAKMSPIWNGKEFEPRLMLPLSLSYDHRVIDGAEAARFSSLLSKLLSDVRELLL